MSNELSRADVLRRGGALLLLSGSGLAALAERANAVGFPDGDVAYLRLVTAAELLKADFQTQALASRKLAAKAAAVVRRMQTDDAAHYAGLTVLMNDAGQPPTTPDDIDFSYPAGAFASQASIVKLAGDLGSLTLGAYLGALENVQTPQLRLPFGQIAANEAQQLSAIAPMLGRPMIGQAFAGAMPIDNVSAALDKFES